jgi:peptide deformylase
MNKAIGGTEGLGLLVRAFCHEIDHLDGILFIDKIIPGSIINQNDLKSEDIYK